MPFQRRQALASRHVPHLECLVAHPNVAVHLNNLGRAHGFLGDHAKKRDMLERALAISERAYGRDHAQVAFNLYNLGMAHGALGDQAKKRELLERALPIWTRAYGTDNRFTKMCQRDLAETSS